MNCKTIRIPGIITIIFLALVYLSACSQNGATNSTSSYDRLSEDEKAIVDYIYSKKDVWETDCTETDFVDGDDGLLFYAASYKLLTTTPTNQFGGDRVWYSFNPEYQTFDVYDSEYRSLSYLGLDDGGYEKSDQEYEPSYDTGWSEEEKKNCLADNYLNYKKGN